MGWVKDDQLLRKNANRALLKYGLARLGLFMALTAVIQTVAWLVGSPFPLLASATGALLIAFPLSMLIFPRMRVEANEAVAAWAQRRRERKEWIAQELSER
ncbi:MULTISPECIES: DUF4229 domain-containing protein [unclassified Corynebacterium]|uniref:DUF4229 domain-containing protein n=1 Tax=unclassified Corynebacterium TaxID=2624378 RepID=UPI0029CA69B5|nr:MULTISPECIES: DUF4229 domain-containing protein [unclassified Corynebacterium]WPF66426.1 DUF4229 domain-containing protein [Corynebacterium sp. 22KM0430]WPF68916.1 DUF4229 domain-containing protein [Corynebacterium sp. 21KM1197]